MSQFFQEIWSRKRVFLLFVPLTLLYSTSYFQRTAIPGQIFNQLQNDLSMDAVHVTYIGAAFIYIYSLSQLFIGYLVDRFGARRVVTLGGLLFCIGVISFPLLNNHSLVYVARMIAGIGAGTMYLSLLRESDRLFGRENYSVMIGVVFVCGYAGGLFGTLPFERLTAAFPWRNVLLAAGLLSCFFYIWFLIAYSTKDGKASSPAAVTKTSGLKETCRMFANIPLWLDVFCGTLNFSIYFVIQTVVGKKLLHDAAGMSSGGAAGVIFALTLVCMTVLMSSATLTRLCNNRRKPLMVFASTLEVINISVMCCALYFKLPSWVFIACFISFAIASGTLISFSLTAQELGSPGTMTRSAGFYNMTNYLGVVMLSPLVGWFLDKFGNPVTKEGVVIHSPDAYLKLFICLLILAVTGAIIVHFIPETRGKFQRQDQRS
ncbi:MAG: MFS transporter [Lentisphaeria bacterium]|nr:MFS transporter [Lentisphaeria bacterium]